MQLTAPIRTYRDLVSGTIPETTWLVESFFVKGSRVLLYGDPGSMKTWLALDLGLHLAAGLPWLGRFTVPAPQSVLYLDEEMGEVEVARRVTQLAKAAHLEHASLPFHVLSQAGVRFSADGIATLRKKIAELDPQVIIVDTLRRVLVGSENDQSDVTDFWRHVLSLMTGGRTVIILHHMRKAGQTGGGDAKYRASGHFDLIAGGDCSYAIATTRDPDGTCAITWRCTKLRGAEEPSDFTVRVADTPDTAATSVTFGDFHTPAPAILPAKVSAVLALCEQHPTLTHNAIYAHAHPQLTQLGVSRSTFYKTFLRHPCAHTQTHTPRETGELSPESVT